MNKRKPILNYSKATSPEELKRYGYACWIPTRDFRLYEEVFPGNNITRGQGQFYEEYTPCTAEDQGKLCKQVETHLNAPD